MTDKTITDIEDFLSALETVRRLGYAVDDEEHSPGMRCIAAIVYDENCQPAAALSITGPSARISQRRIPDLGVKVREMASRITGAIGGRVPPDRQGRL